MIKINLEGPLQQHLEVGGCIMGRIKPHTGRCAMQKAWLMKLNQFPGFKSRRHAGSFSIHRYKWNTGFARFHLWIKLSRCFAPRLYLRRLIQDLHLSKYWVWCVGSPGCGRQANDIRGWGGHSVSAFTPFPWWWPAAKSLARGDTLWSEGTQYQARVMQPQVYLSIGRCTVWY